MPKWARFPGLLLRPWAVACPLACLLFQAWPHTALAPVSCLRPPSLKEPGLSAPLFAEQRQRWARAPGTPSPLPPAPRWTGPAPRHHPCLALAALLTSKEGAEPGGLGWTWKALCLDAIQRRETGALHGPHPGPTGRRTWLTARRDARRAAGRVLPTAADQT